MKRRELNTALVAAIAWAFMQRRASAAAGDPDWVARMHEHGHALRTKAIDAGAWATAMASLAAAIDVTDVLQRIDFDRVASQLRWPDRGAAVQRLDVPGLEGSAVKLFGLRRGCAIVPHGHDGIASMHLVVHGRARVRHWDRIGDASDHVLVWPADDRVHEPGDASTATSVGDNVHWFEAETALTFVFGVSEQGLDPTRPSRRVYVDPERAVVETGDVLRMPVIGRAAAIRRYGRRRE